MTNQSLTTRSLFDQLLPFFIILVFNLVWSPRILAAINCIGNTPSAQAECQALINFYNRTNGDQWSDSSSNNWKMTNTPCNGWVGIMCNNGRIIKIDRRKQNLKGSIPDLSALTELQYLDLSNNQLGGSIPIELNKLTKLKNLYLDHNQFTGPIPDLSALKSLEVLYLGDNPLESGPIPEGIKNLTQLRTLGLSNSQRMGPIPDWISRLTTLEYLQLDYNQLTDSIPNLSQLLKLKWLFLNNNRLTGSIPDLSQATTLEILYLQSNKLSGLIPTSLSNLTKLKHLDLGYNRLTVPDGTWLEFLAKKNPAWKQTQTIPPTDNLKAKTLSKNSVEVSWTPILYTGDGGHYQVKYATLPNGPYTPTNGTTADKNATSYIVNELLPDTTYYFVVETYTPSHSLNQNELVSELSSPVSVSTTVIPPLAPLSLNPLPDEPSNQSTPPVPLDTTVVPPLSSNPLNPDQLTNQSNPPVPAADVTVTSPPALPSSSQLNPDESINNPSSSGATNTTTTSPLKPLAPTMNLTIAFGGKGHGQVTTNPSGLDCDSQKKKCSYSYETASWVELIATPAADSEFTGWGGYQSDCDDGELFMSDTRYCAVYFEKLHFPLTVTVVGQGKVNSTPTGIECGTQCQSRFEINTPVVLTATPNPNWQFEKWQGDCDAKGVVIMNQAKQCEVIFVRVNPDSSQTPLTPTSDTDLSLNPAISDNVSDSSNEIVPQLVVNPGFYYFGQVSVGNLSSAQVITVTNASQADLQLGPLTVSSNEFILTEGCSNQVLSAGSYCAAMINFQPQLAGMKTAYLAIPIADPRQTTVTVVTLTAKSDVVEAPIFLTEERSDPLGERITDLPLLVTFISPFTAKKTPQGVEINWEIAETDHNQIAEIHLWKAQAVKGSCPSDIHQYDPKTALELTNKPHRDYLGINTTCYGLQLIEYNGDITWYITQAE